MKGTPFSPTPLSRQPMDPISRMASTTMNPRLSSASSASVTWPASSRSGTRSSRPTWPKPCRSRSRAWCRDASRPAWGWPFGEWQPMERTDTSCEDQSRGSWPWDKGQNENPSFKRNLSIPTQWPYVSTNSQRKRKIQKGTCSYRYFWKVVVNTIKACHVLQRDLAVTRNLVE